MADEIEELRQAFEKALLATMAFYNHRIAELRTRVAELHDQVIVLEGQLAAAKSHEPPDPDTEEADRG